MLPRALRIAKKDFPLLLKKPDGKSFCATHTLLTKASTSFQFAPIFPKKLKLSSVDQHYWRRVTYHIIGDLLKRHPAWKTIPIAIICIANASFLGRSYQAALEDMEISLKKVLDPKLPQDPA